jgi:hypothetical protein
MTCRDVEARITAYLEGDLDATTSSALRGHLRGCAACRALAEDHARIAGALADLPPAEPPAALWDGVLARVAEAEAADARRSRLAILGARAWARLRPQLVPALAVGAAAAIVLVWTITRSPDGSRTITRSPDGSTITRSPDGSTITRSPDEPHREEAAPAPSPPGPDIEAELAREIERIDTLYAATVAELIAIADEERASWPPPRQRAYDAELARLRSAVAATPLVAVPPPEIEDPYEAAEAAAAAREVRERAWQRLIAFLQRAATGELVAEVTP